MAAHQDARRGDRNRDQARPLPASQPAPQARHRHCVRRSDGAAGVAGNCGAGIGRQARRSGPCVLRAGAGRARRTDVTDDQASNDVCRCRAAPGGPSQSESAGACRMATLLQGQQRSQSPAHHRQLHAAHQPRRAAAALECHPRRHESGWAAAVSILSHEQLRRRVPGGPRERPAGHHRNVAGVVTQRRRPAGAEGARPVLHQELVDLARHLHPAADLARGSQRQGGQVKEQDEGYQPLVRRRAEAFERDQAGGEICRFKPRRPTGRASNVDAA